MTLSCVLLGPEPNSILQKVLCCQIYANNIVRSQAGCSEVNNPSKFLTIGASLAPAIRRLLLDCSQTSAIYGTVLT